ncbi:MAG: trypsin-like peptidase domain-containing protein [Thermoleophilia bacterium]|nr:trypsin-like peptidase domain-containing protein [Thermoleophilia bacterium]
MMHRLIALVVLVVVAQLIAAGCGDDAPSIERATAPDATDVSAASDSDQAKLDQRLEQAVVRVRNLTCQGVATGSGFLIGGNRLVTNHHVVNGAALVEVNLYDGRTVQARVDRVLKADDIGIVQLADGADLPDPLDVATSNPPAGTKVRALGFPLGGEYTVTDGEVVREAAGVVNGMPRLEFTAAVTHGNSGGPLVDERGTVVGIVTEGLEDAKRYFAIPAADLPRLETQGATQVQPCVDTLSANERAAAAGAGGAQPAAIDCTDFDVTGVEGAPGAGYYDISARGISCPAAKRLILGRGFDGDGRAEAAGFACSELAREGETTTWRCEHASDGAAFRYSFGA